MSRKYLLLTASAAVLASGFAMTAVAQEAALELTQASNAEVLVFDLAA